MAIQTVASKQTLQGERFEGGRLELSPGSGPIVLYAERWRAWDHGAPKPDLVRLEGLELRLERLIPAEISSSIALYVGAASKAYRLSV